MLALWREDMIFGDIEWLLRLMLEGCLSTGGLWSDLNLVPFDGRSPERGFSISEGVIVETRSMVVFICA